MKNTFCKRLKKSVSAILAAAMSLSLFTAIPVSAEIGTTTYNYDGYSIDYNVSNEWDGTQIVDITVSNTGDESILNWALKYDAEGEISGLWNAGIYEQKGDEYIIKNNGWNFEIVPDASVTFGYTLNGENLTVPKNFELCSKRVTKTEGFEVTYSINKSWGTGIEGSIDITNLSDYPIEAWTLSFDTNFEIGNLWNGRVLENNGTSYTIAAEEWTNPVQPNSTMSVGFVGTKAEDVEAVLSNFRLTEVVIGDPAPVTPVDPPISDLKITASGNFNEESGNIDLTWESTISEGKFDILVSEDGENFVIADEVTDAAEYTYIIGTDFEVLYFKVRQTVDNQTAESNIVKIENTSKPAEEIIITANAVYDEDSGNIIISWKTNNENGIFEIFVSGDGENFDSVDVVKGVLEYTYATEDDFEKLYFKVLQIVDEQAVESNTVTVVYSIDWSDTTDTDNDGLSDVYEKYYFETDPKNADTDDDGLPDGYEVYYLGTDPTKADTDENGISDGDEDFDKDGLSNFRECELGTDPTNADSDADGLSDADEVNTYNTDPLKYDTDDDEISDGDEVELGLDPNSASTDGIPDSERTFMQHIGPDSESLAAVNTEENPFKVSIDITAAGIAANNLLSHESGYSNAIKNDAILGIAPEFVYTDGLNVEDVVINFDIDNSAAANTNGKYTSLSEEFVGIKRLNVFKYFEDTNMLLPIETFHDVENNRVYTHVDELGTYCLVDMEVWLEGLDISPEGTNENADNEAAPMLLSAMAYPEDSENTESTEEEQKYLDVVLVAYPNKTLLDETKSELKITCKSIFEQAQKENIDVRIFFVSFLGSSIETPDGNIYACNYEEAEEIINRHVGITSALDENIYALYKALNYTANNCVPQFRENSDRFCFVIDVCGYPRVDSGIGAMATFNKNNVRLSFSYNANNTNEQSYMMLSTGACEAAVISAGRYNFEDFIIREIFGDHENEYPIISAVGWKRINLDEPITEEYRNYSFIIENDPSFRYDIISNLELSDTDGDELYDFEEILFQSKSGNDLITFDSSGNVVLPNFEDCTGALPWNRHLFYVKDGLRRYADIAAFQDFYKLRILPIKSDPTNKDSDNDDIDDEEENFIGTSCLSTDTDKDGLDDCTEYINWYDPLNPNPDGDIYNDYEEFVNGTNPYAVDFTAGAWAAEFIKGIVEGDIIEDPSIPALIGQIAGGIAPCIGTVADVRDTIVNASRGDWAMAGMSAIGVIPVGGDISKTVANITQFIAKNGDNTSQIAELIIICSAKSSTTFAIRRASFDDIFKLIPESSYDELFEIYKKGNGKISREHYLKVIEIAKKAGKKIPTIADDFPNATIKELKGVWTDGAWTRGSKIDELLNSHTTGKGLGQNFPIADRMENGTLISTKSIDLGAKTYLDPEKLSKRIEKYIEQINNFEDNVKKWTKDGKVYWGEKPPLELSSITNKKLELALPDIPITEEQAKIINMYALDYNISIVIVRG